ncbi:MAG: alanine racemase, partial [Oscillospiraceae bacterium]|nr:alanine racemase [Oscillospiraceae bacterium]
MYRKWVEISKDKLAENTQKFKKLMRGDAKLMAVVKANAYGHGSVAASRIMLKSGADWLGVSSLGEALILRENGIAAPILNLGYIHPENVSEAIENDIRLTICDLETANEINQICMEDGKKAVVHVKVDTGMNRLGFRVQDLGFRNEVGSIAKMGGLELEGIFTHFWGVSREDCRKQFNEFSDLIDSLDIDIPIKHCANSNAALNFPEFHMDCVRVGIG